MKHGKWITNFSQRPSWYWNNPVLSHISISIRLSEPHSGLTGILAVQEEEEQSQRRRRSWLCLGLVSGEVTLFEQRTNRNEQKCSRKKSLGRFVE